MIGLEEEIRLPDGGCARRRLARTGSV